VTYKKTLHASEQHREDVVKARYDWKKMKPTLDQKRLVFVDETGTNTQMTRLRGRCAKGKRLIDYAPHGHWKTTTFVAGLRSKAITAPLVVDRPMNGVIFLAWLEQQLSPTMAEGDVESAGSQGCRRAGHHRKGWSQIDLSVALFARSQPDRNDVRQAQSLVTKGEGANHRQIMGPHRRPSRRVHAQRVRKLLRS
jgi:hypothetical protein